MQKGKQTKQVRFIEDPYEKSQKTSDVANNKSRICQIDGHSFYPLLQELGLEIQEHHGLSQMILEAFMQQNT